MRRVNGKLGSLLAAHDVQLVTILMFCMKINSQHLLQEVPKQAPIGSMLLKEHQVGEEEPEGGNDD